MTSTTIHLEGLDLAGKTTVGKQLAQRLGATIRHNSLIDSNALHKQAEVLRKAPILDDEALSWLYFACMLIDIDKYRQEEGVWIQDSTIILRSIVHNVGKGAADLVQAFEEKLPVHPEFTLSVFLSSNEDVRLKRLEGRVLRGNDNPEDFIIRDDPKRFRLMNETLRELCITHFDALCIDTSHLEEDGGKDAVVEQILEGLKR
jgi:thymidylate kinase